MAAGMGSRYGGLKQLDPVGPSGETIIDYSVSDAIKAGFNKIVFIIRNEFENEFKEKVTNKYKDDVEVVFAFQELSNLPVIFLYFILSVYIIHNNNLHAILQKIIDKQD